MIGPTELQWDSHATVADHCGRAMVGGRISTHQPDHAGAQRRSVRAGSPGSARRDDRSVRDQTTTRLRRTLHEIATSGTPGRLPARGCRAGARVRAADDRRRRRERLQCGEPAAGRHARHPAGLRPTRVPDGSRQGLRDQRQQLPLHRHRVLEDLLLRHESRLRGRRGHRGRRRDRSVRALDRLGELRSEAGLHRLRCHPDDLQHVQLRGALRLERRHLGVGQRLDVGESGLGLRLQRTRHRGQPDVPRAAAAALGARRVRGRGVAPGVLGHAGGHHQGTARRPREQ